MGWYGPGAGGGTRTWQLCQILAQFLGTLVWSQAPWISAIDLYGADPNSPIGDAVSHWGKGKGFSLLQADSSSS